MADSHPHPHPDPAALLAESRAAWAESGRLPEVPAGLTQTRESLHAVAEQVLKPARLAATGNEIALRWYPGGFGTPAFSDDRGHRIVRVDGVELIDECDGSFRREPLSSLSATGRLVGDLVDTSDFSGNELPMDLISARFLGSWFAFATMVIAELRVGAKAALDPGWVQLWPEHFDVATELGQESDGARAAFGASPGDGEHPEPYLYVAPWTAPTEGELWNSTAFGGAELTYAELRAAGDPVSAAAEFFAARLAALTA